MSRKTILTPKNIMWSTLLMLLVGVALREQLRLPPIKKPLQKFRGHPTVPLFD